MGNPARLVALEYEKETSFAESTATFATHRLPILDGLTLDLKHPNLRPETAAQRLQEGHAPISSVMGGSSFSFRMYMGGHGSSTAGATSVAEPEVFIGDAIGNTAVVSASAGTTLTGGTVTVPTTTASGTYLAGSLAPIGALGDGDGEGQIYAIGDHTTTSLTLLTDMAGAPANGAVLRSAVNFYVNEDPTDTTVNTFRFQFLTGNLQYRMHGCYLTSMKFVGLNTGQVPIYEFTFGVARWTLTASGTFPSTVTSNNYQPAPCAAGSMYVQTVGTTTRATHTVRDVSIDYTHGHAPLMGPGGVGAYQDIVGCVLLPSTITLTFTVDSPSATTSPALNTLFDNTSGVHVLYTLNTISTKQVAFYFPKMFAYGDRPVQINDNGQNRMRITLTAVTGPTTTTNLTASAMRWAYA